MVTILLDISNACVILKPQGNGWRVFPVPVSYTHLLFIALWEDARRRLRRADNIRGFIVNDYDQRNKLSTDFLEYLRTSPDVEDLRALLFQTVIRCV